MPVIIQGGAALLLAAWLAISGMSWFDISKDIEKQNEAIFQEIGEVIDDYREYEQDYAEWLVKSIMRDNIPIEDFPDTVTIRENAWDSYVPEKDTPSAKYLSKKSLDLMKKQLPDKKREYVDELIDTGRTNEKEEIIKQFLWENVIWEEGYNE
ncbi:MAG TPA: hypothetical protein VEA37_14165 [Flavobacterium sp.]|nr:hypothetical protein [Flavobacterium sp.]